MTKKDYEALGKMMARVKAFVGEESQYDGDKNGYLTAKGVYENTMNELCWTLANDNPRFDRDKFKQYVDNGGSYK